jgi:alpha-beta hydrolase superfamily lysophospholipase
VIRAFSVLVSTLHGGSRPCGRERIGAVDALVARPSSVDRPVIVFANAATARGVEDPHVVRFVRALAGAGYVAVAPELPGVRRGEVTPATVEALVAVIGSCGPRITVIGASTGAGLAILAAADPRVADRICGVASIAPFASLRNILRLATTGYYDEAPFDAAPLVGTTATRSLLASAPHDPAVRALVANRNPSRFDDLYVGLLPETRALMDELSPVTRIARVLAPVELASSPDDRFFPVAESLALARAGRDVRLTVTHALEHVRPRLRPSIPRVVALLDRTLERAAPAEPAHVLRPSPAL